MYTALDEHAPPVTGWTTNDLDAQPMDGLRRELIDGVLIVSPTPTYVHQTLAGLLMAELARRCPDHLAVTQAVEVRINEHNALIPDLLVVRADALEERRNRFNPDQVVLAIEIMSPTSRTMDRRAKPAMYAEAGIVAFWRIETFDGIVVHTHRLDRTHRIYDQIDVFDTVIKVEEPWSLELPIASITPHKYQPGL